MIDIHKMDIAVSAGKTDLNLLTVFAALAEHRNVTQAGISLGLSQPAMSAALAKLRAQFNDPLFVRTGRGMRPTPRAEQLAEPVQRVLRAVSSEILNAPAFDASRAVRTFTIITPDIGEAVFLPKILRHGASAAPNVTWRTVSIPSSHAAGALEEGMADLAVGYFPDLARPSFYQQRLFRNTFVCIVRADHPRVGHAVTSAQFLREAHAVVHPAGRTHIFDRFMEKRRIERRIAADLAHFTSLLTVIATTDLIATVPRDVGIVFTRLAGVRMLEPPMQPPPFDVRQHWHRRAHEDEGSIWLRRTVRELFHD